ncbi:MAG: TonB-dependent receptor [Chitinophagaceae bacterium]
MEPRRLTGMKKLLSAALVGCCFCLPCAAQNEPADTTATLGEVIVHAFGQNRRLKESAAAISHISRAQLERFNNTSILPALNSTPGIRMEERSPGSYRLNIRGSTVRSPFGVRNVKVYWNGIPFTDPGGSTYLNQLDYYSFSSIEVIRGPGSSLYGAGTGGVVLINGQPPLFTPGIAVNYVAGSFGLGTLNVQAHAGTEEARHSISYTHQASDGYRDHSAMRRDMASWQARFTPNRRQQLGVSVLYGDLYYQTPGALTRTEYGANPRAARPAAGIFPGADQAGAAIYQKTFLAGITSEYQLSDHVQNSTTVYGAFSQLRNPTFRNYERRTEPHFGGRTVFTWERRQTRSTFKLLWGGEAQKGVFNTKTFTNVNGNPGTADTDDDISNWIYSAFVQADWRLPHDWNITAGASINQSSITITRLSVPGFVPVKRTYNSEWAPRLALSKKVMADGWVYASLSRGFSPPTSQEILPSTTVISTGLEAEQGITYEAGLKSAWLQQRLYVEVNVFTYRLRNAIVQRKDAGNADYFINAGSTRQQGIESQVQYRLPAGAGLISSGRLWISHTWNDFRYADFAKDTISYTGNQLPSVARHTLAAGVDLTCKKGWYTNLTWFYSSRIALNDANTEYAAAYQLAGARIGWKKRAWPQWEINLFAGADNLFDVRYSLGNDINPMGSPRYFNAAAGRNYFAGIGLQWLRPQKP